MDRGSPPGSVPGPLPPVRQAYNIDFIDPLFAVAIHIGLTHGIIGEQWFRTWRTPTGDAPFDLWVFFLGFITMILSWLGYHESIIGKPLRGILRFVLDVFIVTIYALVLVKFNDFGAVLLLLTAVYLLFVLWDIGKIIEYPEMYARGGFMQKYRREIVTFTWFVAFLLLWLGHRGGVLPPTVVLILAYLATILYRINKGVSFLSIIIRPLFGRRQA